MKNIIILNKISEKERVISPVIIVDGERYTGNSHAEILNDLIDNVEIIDTDNGFYYDNNGNEIEIGLFLTNEGRTLNRFETKELNLLEHGDSQDIQEPITQEQLESIFE